MIIDFNRRGLITIRVWLLCLAGVTSVVHAAQDTVPDDRLPQEVLDKIIKRYDAPYITFDAEIVTYIPTRPGFILVPEEKISPGTIFKVIMSRQGDLRYDLIVQGELRFTHKVAVKGLSPSSDSKPVPRYLVTEMDHAGKAIYTELVGTQLETYAGVSISDEVFDHSTWCSAGGYIKTHLGPEGKVATYFVEELKTGFVVSKPKKDGLGLYRVKIIRKPRTAEEAGLYLFITVDGNDGLILENEFQAHHPGKTPQTIRLMRFRNIRFPKVLKNTYDVFEEIPKAARSYRRWEEKVAEESTSEEGD